MADMDIIMAMERLVRAMPRHPEVLELHRLICERFASASDIWPKRTKSNITRTEYMRLYMRAHRNKNLANPFG